MAFSYRLILFRVLVLVLIILNIFVTSQSGVDCRPLSLNYYQWSWDHGLILQSLPNGASPGTGGDPTHP